MALRPLPWLLAVTLGCLFLIGQRPTGPAVVHCERGRTAEPRATLPAGRAAVRAVVPSSSPPIRHSRPGLAKIIYLDFTGEVVSGTYWNSHGGAASYSCRPYDSDGDESHFDEVEQAEIVRIWERVSEDFAPFAVDVTTEAPAASIGGASRTTAWVLITLDHDTADVALPHDGAGGVAVIDCFGAANNAYYAPAWVAGDMLPEDIADAASHEVGHNLGLQHDGTNTGASAAYYHGHAGGGGALSWGPIMGAPYRKMLTLWSKGEYFDANNTQDDLAEIAAKLAYAADDAGNDAASAMPILPDGDDGIAASGTIGSPGDIDAFRLTLAADGAVSIAVRGYRDTGSAGGGSGGDLDIRAILLDGTGAIAASDNPSLSGDANVFVLHALAGTYTLLVEPAGAGTPLADPPTGYTSYGVLGRYTVTGSVPLKPPVVNDSIASGAVGAFLNAVPDAKRASSFTASALPDGLAMDPATGRITGIPTTSGNFTATITGSNPVGSDNGSVSFTIVPLSAPSVNDGSASGTVGVVLHATVTASLATSFSALGLPPGLSINPGTGRIDGTPTTGGIFSASITGTNSAGSDTGTFTFTIASASPAPATASNEGSGGSDGSTCGSGSGIAILLGLFALAFIRRR